MPLLPIAAVLLASLSSGLLAGPAAAAPFRVGINAEVSYKESAAEVRQRYTPFLQELGKLTGHQFDFAPVYSDRVDATLAGDAYDFLLIHTHAALKAERTHGYQTVAFTDDRKNNQVYFFVQANSPLQTLADVGAKRLGVPGLQSWATATATSVLRAQGAVAPKLVSTRYQDVVPVMLALHTADVGVTRSKKLVDEQQASKQLRVLYVTPPMPLNALIAAPGVPAATVDALRGALLLMGQSDAFDALTFKGLTYSSEQSRTLHAFYQ